MRYPGTFARRFAAAIAPAAIGLPTYHGLQQLELISPWTVMLVSGAAGIVYIRIAAMAFDRPLRLPLCLASAILLLLSSYIASAAAFSAASGEAVEATLSAAVLLGIASSAYGFSIIFAGDPPKKRGPSFEEPPAID